MKLLVSAYGCEPGKGSESGVGWNWVRELSRFHELWVITRGNNRAGIEASGEAFVQKVHWVYYDLSRLARLVKKKEKGLYPYYFAWQAGIAKRAKTLHSEVHFDACMHLSFGSMWMPTFLYRLKIPFIWGPVGGGEAVPPEYWPMLSPKERLLQRCRKWLFQLAPLNPFFALPARRAAKIIARTEESRAAFPRRCQNKICVSLETCIDNAVLEMYRPKPPRKPGETLEMVYAGRLISIKAVEIALKALAQAKHRQGMRLRIVGKGPREKALKLVAGKEQLAGVVEFVPYMPRAELLELVRQADVFVFPSLKEGGTWALMEALALGLPCICHDRTGMHVIADKECGIMVEARGPEYSAREFAAAMDFFFENPGRQALMGRNAHQKIARQFTWEQKAQWIERQI